jgi:hypothetical protein
MVKRVLGLLLLALAAVAGAWWYTLPRTSEQLFRARCSNCHALPNVCRYPEQFRDALVDVMRREKGAAAFIDDAEATVIARYLREGIQCP